MVFLYKAGGDDRDDGVKVVGWGKSIFHVLQRNSSQLISGADFSSASTVLYQTVFFMLICKWLS